MAARRPPAVARVLERVTATAREHDMFSPGDRVLVAVSGGPDSVCLLYSLWHLRRLFKIRLEVFHFDHRLRPGSGKDAAYVRRLTERLKLPFHVAAAERGPRKGESIEAWARERRLMAALQAAMAMGAERIAFGHTLDDQAETVLIALVRGGGLSAASGIRPADGMFTHPMLDVRRSEVEAFCRALGLRPRRDPTNADTKLLRNAIRLEALPALERATGRDVKGPLARSAELFRRDLDDLRPPREPVVVGQPTDAGFDLVAEAVVALPGRLPERVVRGVLFDLIGAATSKASIDAVLDLARGRPGRRRHLPGGLIARRDREYVRLARTSPGPAATDSRGGSSDGRTDR